MKHCFSRPTTLETAAESMDCAQLLGAAVAGAVGMALCSRGSLPPIASSADHPIVLLARVKLKPGKRENFLKFAKPLNVAEQHAKPGTLIFTLNADPDDASMLTWTEVYRNDQAWNDHLDMQSESPEMISQFARCDAGDRSIDLDQSLFCAQTCSRPDPADALHCCQCRHSFACCARPELARCWLATCALACPHVRQVPRICGRRFN